jgi:hypothetical protein
MNANRKLVKNKFCHDSSNKLLIGHLDNDKKEDYYCHKSDGSYNTILSGASSVTRFEYLKAHQGKWCKITKDLNVYLGDFNGDGQSDRFCQSSTNGRVWIDFNYDKFKGTNWSDYTLDFCSGLH